MNRVMNVKITGIIAEYNPLHAGHLYHMDETRRRTGCDYVICALSGWFTQRGEPAQFDKFARVEMALAAGIDAVFELPQVYALCPAQLFARGGVGILSALGVDALSFGCETEDVDTLLKAQDLISRVTPEDMEEALSRGESYPRALSAAVSDKDGSLSHLLHSPNFVLALEYISELKRVGSNAEVCPILRNAPYHEESDGENSASSVRRMLREGRRGEVLSSLPEEIAVLYRRELVSGCPDPQKLDTLLLWALRRADPGSVRSPDDAEGLFRRVQAAALGSASFEEALRTAKCKRYTLSRIRRLMMNAILSLPDAPEAPPYLRLLGAKKSAEPLLKELASRSGRRIVTRAAELKDDAVFRAECRASELWGLATGDDGYRRAGREFTRGFISL